MDTSSFTSSSGSISVLKYRVWPIFEGKTTSLFILSVTCMITYLAWLSLGSWLLTVGVFAIQVASLRSSVFPVMFEMNTVGITRWRLGAKQFVPWSNIHSYRVLDQGIIILPPGQPYYLSPFRSIFIAVPRSLRTEVTARFQMSVEQLPCENW